MQKINTKKERTSRTLCIGDIHGGYRGMIQALERAGFDKENDTLISLGDIADGWSETPKCVEYLLSCKNLIAIRGNHDDWANTWFQTTSALNQWVTQGGQATKHAYEQANMAHDFDMEAHKEFFRKQINYYVDDENRAFTHGGFTSDKGVGHESNQNEYFWNRRMWEIALSGKNSEMTPSRLRGHKEIFIGHTTTMMWDTDEPMNACNVWNLDTGGGWAGKITVMCVDTKEFWQSDNMKELYKDEKGR